MEETVSVSEAPLPFVPHVVPPPLPDDTIMILDRYKRLSREQKRVVRELVRHYDSGWLDFWDSAEAGPLELSRHSAKKLRVVEELTSACKRMDETRGRLERAERELERLLHAIDGLSDFMQDMYEFGWLDIEQEATPEAMPF